MPADTDLATLPDWKLAQTLYLQGLPAETISERTGATVSAIRTRACRENWKGFAVAAKAAAIQDIANAWQRDMIEWLKERAECLRKLSPRDIAEAQKLEGTIAQHVDTGRKLLGLEKPDRADAFGGGRVIDIASVTTAASPTPPQPPTS